MSKLIRCIVTILSILALTLTAVASPARAVVIEPAPAEASSGDGRMEFLYNPEKGVFYYRPFVEQTGEGWEPPQQKPDGTWHQRFVYDGVAYSPGHYAWLAEPPYPYPYVMLPNSTATWIPQWGSWYLKYTKEQAYLDSIISAQGGGSYVRDMDGRVSERFRPLPKAQ